MVGSCFTVGVFCVGGAMLALLLKQYCAEQSMLISVAVCTLVFAAVVVMLEEPVNEVRAIFEKAGVPESSISIIFKALGISCITHISAEICRDSGEGAMGAAAELWGRVAVAMLSLPIMKSFLQLIDKLL
jgi:stage III sporulation protein AD